jgi:hypothetical protein
VRVPEDWRPVDLQGEWGKGNAVIGDADAGLMQVKWWRPASRSFDPRRWAAARARAMAAALGAGPMPEGFEESSFFGEVPSRGGGARAIWFGWHPGARLAIEAAVNLGGGAGARRALRDVLPGLRCAPADGPQDWAVFGSSFRSPAGFRLEAKRIFSGDVALRLSGGRRARLVLRQVYPAAVALQRRPIEKWLAAFPFEEHRRRREAGRPEPWTVKGDGEALEGVRVSGVKRLRFPFGSVSSRPSSACALVDCGMDRLLLAEYDAVDPEPGLLEWAVRAMNWAVKR